MLHEMRLKAQEFDNIKNLNKIMEVRLNDEKRKLVNEGDTIIFHRMPELVESIVADVEKIYRFSTFQELYNSFPSSCFGYSGLSMEEILSKIYSIYSINQERENGVIAIRFHIQKLKNYPK